MDCIVPKTHKSPGRRPASSSDGRFDGFRTFVSLGKDEMDDPHAKYLLGSLASIPFFGTCPKSMFQKRDIFAALPKREKAIRESKAGD